MNESQVRSLEQVRQVLQGTQALQFRRPDDETGRYGWIDSVLQRFAYRSLGRADRGLVRGYVQRLSGYSRSQVTRLVDRWTAGRPLVKQYHASAQAFARRYTAADVVLLAEVDRAMDTLSGPATVCVLRRQRDFFGDALFERLGWISVAHLYNLRASERYRAQRVVRTRRVPRKRSPSAPARPDQEEQGAESQQLRRHRRAPVHPALGHGRAGHERRAAGRFVRRDPHQVARLFPARRRRPALRGPAVHRRRGAGRRRRGRDARRQDQPVDSGRHTRRPHVPSARQGRQGRTVDHPGDHFCHVGVETPVRLTDKRKKLLREFDTGLKEGGVKHSPPPRPRGSRTR